MTGLMPAPWADLIRQIVNYSRLRFHRWRVRRLCPCGYDEEGCRCVTDPADEIAH